MIAWWGWLLIWLGLGLTLIAMLVLVGLVLFRKLMAMFAALETLTAKLEILDRVSDLADEQREHVERLAILAGEDATRERRDRVRDATRARKDARHDKRIARGKALLKVDASARKWFPATTPNGRRKAPRANGQ